MCGLIEFYINKCPMLNLGNKMITTYTYDKIMLERSNVPVNSNFLISDKVFPNRKLHKQQLEYMTSESRKIFFA